MNFLFYEFFFGFADRLERWSFIGLVIHYYFSSEKNSSILRLNEQTLQVKCEHLERFLNAICSYIIS